MVRFFFWGEGGNVLKWPENGDPWVIGRAMVRESGLHVREKEKGERIKFDVGTVSFVKKMSSGRNGACVGNIIEKCSDFL